MPKQTPNMNLYKVDGEADRNDTFNVDVVLNDNWDKIDSAVGQIQEDLENIDVDIPDASLTQKGIVQLNDTLSSTSKTMAATADALRRVYEEATAGKQLGVEQKANVVAALNSIGVTATTGETWPQLITKIRAVIRATGNATAADILAGKNASNASGPVTGTMPHRSAENSHMPGTNWTTWAGDRVFITPPHGYYDGASWVTAPAPNLKAENIPKDTTILGIQGMLERMTQVEKQNFATAITDKGVPASANDSNTVLANKIGQIPTGVKIARGSFYRDGGTVANLPFKPIVLIYNVAASGYNAHNEQLSISGYVGAYLDEQSVVRTFSISGSFSGVYFPISVDIYPNSIKFGDNSVTAYIYYSGSPQFSSVSYTVFGA